MEKPAALLYADAMSAMSRGALDEGNDDRAARAEAQDSFEVGVLQRLHRREERAGEQADEYLKAAHLVPFKGVHAGEARAAQRKYEAGSHNELQEADEGRQRQRLDNELVDDHEQRGAQAEANARHGRPRRGRGDHCVGEGGVLRVRLVGGRAVDGASAAACWQGPTTIPLARRVDRASLHTRPATALATAHPSREEAAEFCTRSGRNDDP